MEKRKCFICEQIKDDIDIILPFEVEPGRYLDVFCCDDCYYEIHDNHSDDSN